MKIISTTILIFFCAAATFAQQKIFRNYSTQKVNERLAKEDVQLLDKQGNVEFFIENKKKKLQFKKVTIPVVFHILYVQGQNYPSADQVYTQIDALNRDFSKRAYRIQQKADTLEGFDKSVAETEIEFCLAKVGPSGKNEAAIRFIPVTTEKFVDNDLIKTERFGALSWDTEQYLNIWVGNLADSISGYAQMPGGPKATDGIVIDNRYFGTIGTAKAPYNEGKTLTHLVGNYLGLYDLWNKRTPCGDDYVEDTPIHNAPNYNCEDYRHVSTCGDNPVEMTMNFMDNSPDACLYMFTQGQKTRMQAVLSEKGPREKLVLANVKCSNKFTEEDSTGSVVFLDKPRLKSASLESISVSIAPNPAYDQFKVQIQTELEIRTKASLSVINALGMIKFNQSLDLTRGTQDLIMDCRNWSPGIYYLSVHTNDYHSTHRIVVISK